MSLDTQINVITCGSAVALGTGLAGCRINRKRVEAIGLVQRGFIFTQAIDKAYMRTLQQNGTLIMLQGVVSFVDATAADNIITRPGSGIKVVAGKNPYDFNVTFDNGINFQKALVSLSSYSGFDLILFDVDNSMFFTTTKSGLPKGFKLGMFEAGKYMGSDGAEASSQVVSLQLTERAEVDERQAVITDDGLNFIYDELTGVNQVIVTVDTISAASTSIVLSAFLSDKSTSVEGLLVTNFSVLRNGVPVVPSAAVYNATTKKYTLTVTANTVGAVTLTSLNGIVLVAADVLYKSNIASNVVV